MLKKKRLKIVITAGPTKEYIDPVRYISNDSSGKMGYSLAAKANHFGYETVLISGPTPLNQPENVKFIPVISAGEMLNTALDEFSDADIFVAVAAVSDFRPKKYSEKKLKKGNLQTLELKQNPDILYEVGKIKRSGQFTVGFALESEELIVNAINKMQEKNCDLIAANGLENIGSEAGKIAIIDRDQKKYSFEGTKDELAEDILNIFDHYFHTT